MSKQPKFVLDALKRGGLYINDYETGQQLYYRLARSLGNWENGERLASLKLNKLGIPGHRFWDALSRNDKNGTHNFVIWNTDTLSLLGLTDDSETDAHDYFHSEEYSRAYLDSLDNDSDIQEYGSDDWQRELDTFANGQLDALDYDNEAYRQSIGLQGAWELDWKNGTNSRYDAYSIAVKMDRQGKNPKAIRFATGWEKAPDGHWRYEIQYGNILPEALKKNKNSFALGEIFDAPELFDAYSKISITRKGKNHKFSMRSIRVRFSDLIGEKQYGIFHPKNFSIEIAQSLRLNPKKLRYTLIHEIQHAIQYIEGFAPGGSPENFEAEYQIFKKQEEAINKRFKELDDITGAYDNVLAEMNELKLNGNYPESYSASERLETVRLNSVHGDEYKKLYQQLRDLRKWLDTSR